MEWKHVHVANIVTKITGKRRFTIRFAAIYFAALFVLSACSAPDPRAFVDSTIGLSDDCRAYVHTKDAAVNARYDDLILNNRDRFDQERPELSKLEADLIDDAHTVGNKCTAKLKYKSDSWYTLVLYTAGLIENAVAVAEARGDRSEGCQLALSNGKVYDAVEPWVFHLPDEHRYQALIDSYNKMVTVNNGSQRRDCVNQGQSLIPGSR